MNNRIEITDDSNNKSQHLYHVICKEVTENKIPAPEILMVLEIIKMQLLTQSVVKEQPNS